jgi:hypothetical protein
MFISFVSSFSCAPTDAKGKSERIATGRVCGYYREMDREISLFIAKRRRYLEEGRKVTFDASDYEPKRKRRVDICVY